LASDAMKDCRDGCRKWHAQRQSLHDHGGSRKLELIHVAKKRIITAATTWTGIIGIGTAFHLDSGRTRIERVRKRKDGREEYR
jgi:hypothetical protein